jgi:hypothetical protein
MLVQAEILRVMLLSSSKCLCRKPKLYRIIVATLRYCTHPPNPVFSLLEAFSSGDNAIAGLRE